MRLLFLLCFVFLFELVFSQDEYVYTDKGELDLVKQAWAANGQYKVGDKVVVYVHIQECTRNFATNQDDCNQGMFGNVDGADFSCCIPNPDGLHRMGVFFVTVDDFSILVLHGSFAAFEGLDSVVWVELGGPGANTSAGITKFYSKTDAMNGDIYVPQSSAVVYTADAGACANHVRPCGAPLFIAWDEGIGCADDAGCVCVNKECGRRRLDAPSDWQKGDFRVLLAWSGADASSPTKLFRSDGQLLSKLKRFAFGSIQQVFSTSVDSSLSSGIETSVPIDG